MTDTTSTNNRKDEGMLGLGAMSIETLVILGLMLLAAAYHRQGKRRARSSPGIGHRTN